MICKWWWLRSDDRRHNTFKWSGDRAANNSEQSRRWRGRASLVPELGLRALWSPCVNLDNVFVTLIEVLQQVYKLLLLLSHVYWQQLGGGYRARVLG